MSFTLKYQNQEKQFKKKVMLIDLIEDKEMNYICARVNNRIRELTYEVSEDATIDFLTVKDQDAIKTYETSLRYLVAMAFERALPHLEMRFSYNISRSIFVQFINTPQQSSFALLKKVEEEMDKIVKANYPLNRRIVSKKEAARIYEELEQEDKLELLKFRPEKTAHFYECDGYLNYMFGRMVPSTGYLKNYKIKLYSPGFIVQYPRFEEKGEIPKFEDAPTFGKTLKDSHQWGKIARADSIPKINTHIVRNGVVDFINICETRHNRMLTELGNMIESNIESVRLICIAGPSSSGKTTFSNRLRIELLSRGIQPIRLSIDDYYLPKSEAPVDENGEPDLESINALDIELFNNNMLELISGNEIQLPKFDFQLSKRIPGRTLKVAKDQPIIIEGIHALNDLLTEGIPKSQKFKIYIAPQAQINFDNHNPMSLTDLRLLRRMVRDKKYRNASFEETISMWPSVRKGEFKWIYSTQEGADYVYNSFLSYELSVMRKYALPLLNKIETNSVHFPVAERLIRLLKYFQDMSDEWVPSNSLLREFIGGSCYADVDN